MTPVQGNSTKKSLKKATGGHYFNEGCSSLYLNIDFIGSGHRSSEEEKHAGFPGNSKPGLRHQMIKKHSSRENSIEHVQSVGMDTEIMVHGKSIEQSQESKTLYHQQTPI